MNNLLPHEILNAIFIILPIIQKQECMLVCKKWASIIGTSSLFHTIHINYDINTFKKCIAMFQDQPLLGHQVSELNVTGSIPGDYDERQLLVLFPNLKVLKAIRNNKENVDGQHVSLHHVEGLRLEHIQDVARFELTKLVLTFPSSSLVSLIMDFDYDSNNTELNNSLFPLLKNAPLLNHLCLVDCEISNQLFQLIHVNAPMLRSLTIYDGIPLEPDTSMGITPMTTLRSLVVDMGGFDDQTAFQWLHYFSQKYPNVENVDIGKLDLSLTDPLIWCCPGIFRRVTALHLTSLLEMDEYISLFDLLDKDACQIKQLKLHGANADCLGVLMRSDQSRYIQDLKLLDSEETTGFEWLSNLTSLTSLSLDYYSPQDQICLESSPALHLNDLLEACPSTVESISVLKIKITYDIGKPFPWIKCLKLVYSPTPLVGIDQFISACLPALTTLWLSLKVNTYHGVPILTMPNHHFASLHLFIRYPTPPYFKLVTSERTRCFATSISGNDYAILGNVLPRVMEREESMPTVHCASTKELYINEQCAYC